MWINSFLQLPMPQYERIAVFPATWINLLIFVNISCRTLVKLWKDVDNKSFTSSFNVLVVSESYPQVMQGFSTIFPPLFPQYFYLLARFIFQLASCLSFVLDVGRYVFRLTTNHLFSHPIKQVQNLMTNQGLIIVKSSFSRACAYARTLHFCTFCFHNLHRFPSNTFYSNGLSAFYKHLFNVSRRMA